jgi:methionyl-tRNA formyltransferase
VASLRGIVTARHEVTVVVSRADRRRSRGVALLPSPVKAAGLELGLPVSEDLDDVVRSGAELAVVVAYGRLIPAPLLDRLPFVNLHLSLLPRWRGAAPVERAILAGDEMTGVSLMALDEGLDTGPVYGQLPVALDAAVTASELGEQLVTLGTADLTARLARGMDGLGEARPQRGVPRYAEKITAAERLLDFASSATVCHRVVRIGRAATSFRGARLLVHRAEEVPGSFGAPGTLVGDTVATGEGGLRLLVVQAAGRRALGFADFASGARLTPGERLGDPLPPVAPR